MLVIAQAIPEENTRVLVSVALISSSLYFLFPWLLLALTER